MLQLLDATTYDSHSFSRFLAGFDEWNRALQPARLSQKRFREAERKRGRGDFGGFDCKRVELHMGYYFHSSSRLIYHFLTLS